jgi:general secretion pathway protein B
MSFILDALKKSEQERRQRQTPDLHAEHAPPPEQRGGKRLWPILILVALLLNVAVFSFWLRPWSAPEPSVQKELSAVDESIIASETIAAPPLPVASQPVASQPAVSQPAVSQPAVSQPAVSQPAVSQPAVSQPAVSSAAVERTSPASEEITPSSAESSVKPSLPVAKRAPETSNVPPSLPRMEDLPNSFRRELPELVISLHFYTDSPTARMVRINGRNLREKQHISENLTLQEITAEGVILNFKGQAFAVKNF